jgi:putative membrane protein
MTNNRTFEPSNILLAAILIVKGALIGIANIIPGVSGGTFALILGIYERLIESLKSFTYTNVKVLILGLLTAANKQSRIRFLNLLKQMDVIFLICLAAGAGTAILGLSFAIDYLLTEFPGRTLSFFLGLIIPSIAIPYKMMAKYKSAAHLIMAVPGVLLTVGLSLSFGSIANFGDHFVWSFVTGVIAISAMILPGISGSFVLLVMGQYQNILRKLQAVQTSFDVKAVLWLAVFAFGCIAGLLLFARLLDLLMKHYRNATLAFLIGLIIGSFWILWPFKDFQEPPDLTHIEEEFRDRVSDKQDIRIATAPNSFPQSTAEILWNGLFFVLGVAGAAGMNKLGTGHTVKQNKPYQNL